MVKKMNIVAHPRVFKLYQSGRIEYHDAAKDPSGVTGLQATRITTATVTTRGDQSEAVVSGLCEYGALSPNSAPAKLALGLVARGGKAGRAPGDVHHTVRECHCVEALAPTRTAGEASGDADKNPPVTAAAAAAASPGCLRRLHS